MSAHNSFAIFNVPSDLHLDLVARLVDVNLDCLERMVSTQFSPIKEYSGPRNSDSGLS